MSKRFSPESPGPLAELEAQWLRENKGIEVTAQQVRAVLMYHGEFQKSPVRHAQRVAEQQAKAQRDAEHQARQAERQEKLAERLAKAKERVAELEAKSQANQEVSPKAPTTRRTKAPAEKVSA